jgi:hypothetical protein
MNKKTLNLIIGALFIAGAIVFLAVYRPAPTQHSGLTQVASGESLLSAEELSFDFGAISMAKGNVSHQFKIKNSTDAPVTIKKIHTSCMCTTATLYINENKVAGPFGMAGHGFIPKISKTLEAGEEAVVLVAFDPTAHGPAGIGQTEREIYIETENGSPLILQIKANVTP